MQLVWVQFLPLLQRFDSQGRVQGQYTNPMGGIAEIFRLLHSTAVLT